MEGLLSGISRVQPWSLKMKSVISRNGLVKAILISCMLMLTSCPGMTVNGVPVDLDCKDRAEVQRAINSCQDQCEPFNSEYSQCMRNCASICRESTGLIPPNSCGSGQHSSFQNGALYSEAFRTSNTCLARGVLHLPSDSPADSEI